MFVELSETKYEPSQTTVQVKPPEPVVERKQPCGVYFFLFIFFGIGVGALFFSIKEQITFSEQLVGCDSTECYVGASLSFFLLNGIGLCGIIICFLSLYGIVHPQ